MLETSSFIITFNECRKRLVIEIVFLSVYLKGDAMGGGHSGAVPPTGTWCPPKKKGTAVEKLDDSGQSVSS